MNGKSFAHQIFLQTSAFSVHALSISFLMGCASHPDKVQTLSTHLEKASPVVAEQLGIKEDRLMVQKVSPIAERLRALQVDVYALEAQAYGGRRYYGSPGLWGALNSCRLHIASVGNGGSGKPGYIEPNDYVVPEEDFGQPGVEKGSGELIVMNQEPLKERVARFTRYKQILSERAQSLQTSLDICQLDLEAQLKRNEKERKPATSED